MDTKNRKLKNKFTRENQKFWRNFQEGNHKNILLVETNNHPVINHANAIMGKIVAQAKKFQIAWLNDSQIDIDLLRSYSSNSIIMLYPQIDFLNRLFLLLQSFLFYFYYVLFKRNLLAFKYKHIPYGDFVYDIYLQRYCLATLHLLDMRIIYTLYLVLSKDYLARKILSDKNIKAILVSHHIGLRSGPLSRVALQKNIPVYWKGGGEGVINLSIYRSIKQIYRYPKMPPEKFVNSSTAKQRLLLSKEFNKFISNKKNILYKKAFSLGFNKRIESKTTKQSFIRKYNLKDRPIVFIMLHVFNDHPHSHFKSMLFQDYYHWFIETLNFAKKDKTKNWIFKEHPANEYYPTHDLNLKSLMKKLPDNIRFISRNSKVTGSVVLNVADLVVTCLGSAGLEMPALKGMPSVIASDTFYADFNFAIKPKSKGDYFKILKKLRIQPLSLEKQLKAQACFLYLKKYSLMPFSAGPAITFEQSKNLNNLKKDYYQKVIKIYEQKERQILKEFNQYKVIIKKKGFERLERLPYEH